LTSGLPPNQVAKVLSNLSDRPDRLDVVQWDRDVEAILQRSDQLENAHGIETEVEREITFGSRLNRLAADALHDRNDLRLDPDV